jgi:cyclophilin family peptidyl-prolyl cis-trans isomerase
VDFRVKKFESFNFTEEEKIMAANPVVSMSTSLGEVRVEILLDQAPLTAKNFLDYVNDKFYDGLIFHRVIPGFMIQGGGFDEQMREKQAKTAVKNEAANGLKNDTGTLAMARTSVVDSATCQFFINVKNNDFLNHQNPSPQGFGYAVFGRVTEGMEVVQKIEKVKTGSRGMHQDVPVQSVVIQSMRVI